MKKIVVGFDGREPAHDALALGRSMAEAFGAELAVACVYEQNPLLGDLSLSEGGPAGYFERLNGDAEEALEGTAFSRREITVSSAAEGLHHIAWNDSADLIVLGSTHLGRLGRVLSGSVAERLLHGAPCAVAVAPRGLARSGAARIGRVGVGYDGSEEANVALEEAVRFAMAIAGELRVIAVAGKVPASLKLAGREGVLRERCSRILDEAMLVVGDRVPARASSEEGDPAVVLAEKANELDLLVVGSRGYGPVRQTLLGGVSSKLIRSAPCPVVVVPRSATSESGRAPVLAAEGAA